MVVQLAFGENRPVLIAIHFVMYGYLTCNRRVYMQLRILRALDISKVVPELPQTVNIIDETLTWQWGFLTKKVEGKIGGSILLCSSSANMRL